MAEYRTEKCPACGHERRGPRIVRISQTDARRLTETETRSEKISVLASIGLALLLFFLVFCVVAALQFTGPVHPLIVLGGMTLAGFVVINRTINWMRKRFEELNSQKQQILAGYGVQPHERYELAES